MLDNNLFILILIGLLFYMLYTCTNNDITEEFDNQPIKTDNKHHANFFTPTDHYKQTTMDKPPHLESSSDVSKNENEYIENTKNTLPINDNSINSTEQQTLKKQIDYTLGVKNTDAPEKYKSMIYDSKREVATTKDLLPKDKNNDWFEIPNDEFDLEKAIDLEIPEIKIGIDTVGQSRKNATYDLRAAPPNPKFIVSPWLNSTIEPDYNTKPLC